MLRGYFKQRKIREDGGQMNFFRLATKISAVSFLLFVISNAALAQNGYELPSGTKFRVRMDNEINSKVSSKGDTFTATVFEPVRISETVVLPIGTVIEGRIIKVRRASAGNKDGEMEVKFEKMRFTGGDKREIEGILATPLKAGKSSSTATVLTVIGGTAAGVLLGAATKSASGALIGAGIGSGAGGAVAYLRKGKDVKIRADEKFEIEITRNVILPVEDF
jgi:hypothetical protein